VISLVPLVALLSSGVPSDDPASAEAARLARAQAQYDQRYVWFEDRLARNDLGVAREVTLVRQGKQAALLIGEAAYLAIDRPDLAETYRVRKITKWSLFFGGLALSAGAYAYRQLGVSCISIDPANGACSQREPIRWWTATGVTVGGFATAIFALIWNPNPVVGEDFKKLGEQFNQRLRRELGLATLSTTAAIDSTGARFALTGTF
jgi:hypothetical protein